MVHLLCLKESISRPLFPGDDTGTLSDYLIGMFLKVLPEWILPALKRPDRINRTSFPVVFKKDAIKALSGKSLFDGESMVNTIETGLNKINYRYV
jgi:hypothetical protein